jgi:flavin reductase (DIM6/NTAB) family NADH-FMN oxidoreductase RutF
VKRIDQAAIEMMRTGLYVVTTKNLDEKAGCTVAWGCRASVDPPMILVCISPKRTTYSVIRESGNFCLNILGEDGTEMAKTFGFKSSKDVDKFAGLKYDVKASGAPVLADAVAYVDCRLFGSYNAGDHYVMLGEVVEAAVQREGAPKIYNSKEFFP